MSITLSNGDPLVANLIDSEYNQHSQQATVVRAGVGGDRQ